MRESTRRILNKQLQLVPPKLGRLKNQKPQALLKLKKLTYFSVLIKKLNYQILKLFRN